MFYSLSMGHWHSTRHEATLILFPNCQIANSWVHLDSVESEFIQWHWVTRRIPRKAEEWDQRTRNNAPNCAAAPTYPNRMQLPPSQGTVTTVHITDTKMLGQDAACKNCCFCVICVSLGNWYRSLHYCCYSYHPTRMDSASCSSLQFNVLGGWIWLVELRFCFGALRNTGNTRRRFICCVFEAGIKFSF